MSDIPAHLRSMGGKFLQTPTLSAAPPPPPTPPKIDLRPRGPIETVPVPTWYVPRTNPYDHQSTALGRAWDQEGFGWLMEMGTGKSKVCIDNGAMLFEAPQFIDCEGIELMVIFAPKGTYANWVLKEIPIHMPERILGNAIIHLWKGGHTKAEQRELEWLMEAPGRRLRILVVNTEGFATSDRAEKWVHRLVKRFRAFVPVDESSTIKNPTAIRTKKLIKLRDLVPYRRILTGSPVPQGPMDLWSQFEFLKSGALGSKSFYGFRGQWAITQKKDFGGRSVDVIVGYRNIEKLAGIVARAAMVVKKEDCLTLPPKVYTTRTVQLTPEQERLYKELRDWATTQLANGAFVTTTIVITQLLRLHQIVCGHVTDEVGEMHDVPSNRPAALSEVLDEIDGKTIVWASYRRDIDKLMAHLTAEGRKVVRYDGQTGEDERRAAVVAFQEGDADVFLGTPNVGGYGITLTAARAVVYYSNNYDLEKRMQSEDRAHRIGQTRSVTYVDLIAPGTVDEKIVEALKKKESLAQIIMDGPARIRELLS